MDGPPGVADCDGWADKGDLASDDCPVMAVMLILRERDRLPAGLIKDLGVPVLDKPN